jgi:DNA polymerase III delta prime subunit
MNYNILFKDDYGDIYRLVEEEKCGAIWLGFEMIENGKWISFVQPRSKSFRLGINTEIGMLFEGDELDVPGYYIGDSWNRPFKGKVEYSPENIDDYMWTVGNTSLDEVVMQIRGERMRKEKIDEQKKAEKLAEEKRKIIEDEKIFNKMINM